MCNHAWKKIDEFRICVKCGITKLPSGHLYLDRELPNFKRGKKRNGKKKESVLP